LKNFSSAHVEQQRSLAQKCQKVSARALFGRKSSQAFSKLFPALAHLSQRTVSASAHFVKKTLSARAHFVKKNECSRSLKNFPSAVAIKMNANKRER